MSLHLPDSIEARLTTARDTTAQVQLVPTLAAMAEIDRLPREGGGGAASALQAVSAI